MLVNLGNISSSGAFNMPRPLALSRQKKFLFMFLSDNLFFDWKGDFIRKSLKLLLDK